MGDPVSNLEHLGTHVSGSLEHARSGADADASAARVRERLVRGEGRNRAAAGGGLRVRRGAILGALAVAAALGVALNRRRRR